MDTLLYQNNWWGDLVETGQTHGLAEMTLEKANLVPGEFCTPKDIKLSYIIDEDI